mgnify:CR=1 FL=1|jgi:hypothetical protein
MDEKYFAEFKTGVTNAWQVKLGNWVLYNGLPPVVLSGSAPSVPFRLAVTISPVPAGETSPAHADLVGSISINSEVLNFTKATRLTTATELTALPSVTVSGLDCNILIECITASGEPIQKENLTNIEIICFPQTHILRDPSGSGWQQTDYTIYCEIPMSIGDQIRFPDPHQGGKTIDVYVKNVSSAVDLEYGNTQPFRVYDCA